MSDLTLREPMLPEPTLPEPRVFGRWIVWPALASLVLHAGFLAFLLWQPSPDSVEAEPPPAVDVELVPPPEAASASEPPPSEEAAPEEETAGQAEAEPAAAPEAEPAAGPPAESSAEPPPEPAAEASAPETPAEAEDTQTETEASGAAPESEAVSVASETPQGAEATAKVAPIPLPRPKVRGLTAPADAPAEGAAGPDVTVDGAAPAAESEGPDVATLELGAPRNADRFYLEAMLSMPSLAPAREMLKTQPPEKRLAQTCNIEALAQIGNAGEGFAPDVVMAEAYARSEMTGTRLVANGAIFRSGEKWFGFAFDCTLSDDLTAVTAFSYRLGADVTEAVLARLGGN